MFVNLIRSTTHKELSTNIKLFVRRQVFDRQFILSIYFGHFGTVWIALQPGRDCVMRRYLFMWLLIRITIYWYQLHMNIYIVLQAQFVYVTRQIEKKNQSIFVFFDENILNWDYLAKLNFLSNFKFLRPNYLHKHICIYAYIYIYIYIYI